MVKLRRWFKVIVFSWSWQKLPVANHVSILHGRVIGWSSA
jgi:hypothetical protein